MLFKQDDVLWNLGNKVHYYEKLDILESIVENLFEEQLDLFRKGPFGHLIDFQIKKCPGQLLVHLII